MIKGQALSMPLLKRVQRSKQGKVGAEVKSPGSFLCSSVGLERESHHSQSLWSLVP